MVSTVHSFVHPIALFCDAILFVYDYSVGRVSEYLDSWLRLVRSYYVTIAYLSIKLVYIVSILAQFAVVQTLLKIHSPTFGWDIIKDLYNGREWHVSGLFPRVTLCDFEVWLLLIKRTLGGRQQR